MVFEPEPDTVRNITRRQMVESKHSAGKLLEGRAGGLLGNSVWRWARAGDYCRRSERWRATAVQRFRSGGNDDGGKLTLGELLITTSRSRLINGDPGITIRP